ncbi:MAG: hypothetical protein EPO24_13150, partial [Bacteroidetes bacterium]
MLKSSTRRATTLLGFCAMFFFTAFSQSASDSLLSLERIFLKPYIAGTRPSSPILSNDGGFIIYSWDSKAENKYRYWMMNSDGTRRYQVADTTLGDIELSSDSRTVACTRNGDIFITDTSFTNFERMTKTDAYESGLRWAPNGRLLAYYSDKKLYAASVWKLALYEVAKPSSENSYIRMHDFFPDSKRVLFSETNQETLK